MDLVGGIIGLEFLVRPDPTDDHFDFIPFAHFEGVFLHDICGAARYDRDKIRSRIEREFEKSPFEISDSVICLAGSFGKDKETSFFKDLGCMFHVLVGPSGTVSVYAKGSRRPEMEVEKRDTEELFFRNKGEGKRHNGIQDKDVQKALVI
jgi:hypothetical protein